MAKKQKKSPHTSVLNQATMDFLGLSQQPFTASILSEDAIFIHRALTQLKDTIKHHLQSSDLILVVEGNYGSGKTTFFRQMMQDDMDNVFLMPLQAEATDTLVQIQQKMSIHLKEHGDANHLEDNLKNLQMFDQTPVLMIDDAHVLSDTTLQELIRYRQQLFADNQLQLKILLFANRGMAGTLEQVSDIQHSQMFVQELPTLDTRQIPAFIGHRLAIAGASQPPVLDEKQVQDIYKKSAGNPMRVMAAAKGTLDTLSKKSRHHFSMALPGKATGLFIALTLGAVGLIGGYFYLSDTQPVQHAQEQAPVIQDESAVEAPAPEPRPQNMLAAPAEDNDLQMAPTPEHSQDSPVPLEPGENQAPMDAPAIAVTAEDTPRETDEEPSAPIAPSTLPAPSPSIRPSTEPGVTEDSQQPAKLAPAAGPAPAPAPVQEKQQPGNPAFEALAQLGLKDAGWLQQQDPGLWTLQILGARDPATLVNFAKQHQLGGETAWYETDLKGQPWYVLVHRIYRDRENARQSVERLPAGLQRNRPWAKSLASVQQSIPRRTR